MRLLDLEIQVFRRGRSLENSQGGSELEDRGQRNVDLRREKLASELESGENEYDQFGNHQST